MKNLNKTALILAVSLTALLVSGCDYVPREKFNVKTEDGKVLTFACPVLDLERSPFTYFYYGDCVVTKVTEGN